MSYEIHEKDDSEQLDEPIKIWWTGYARGRITEYNGEYEEEWSDSPLNPELFVKACTRLKTQVVVCTVAEADALRYELTSYDSGQRTWMNSSMDRALNRVARELTEEMEDRGYEAQWEPIAGMPSFMGYEPI